MSAWIERAYWWWMLRFSKVNNVGGLRFIFISAADDRSDGEIRAVLADAMNRIASARGGFGELVKDHVRFVAALDAPAPVALLYARGYVSPFSGQEARNPHFLACRIIWAATYVRLSQNALVHEVDRDIRAIRAASYDAQLRFTRQFPDAEEWIVYLENHPAGI